MVLIVSLIFFSGFQPSQIVSKQAVAFVGVTLITHRIGLSLTKISPWELLAAQG